MLWFVAKSSYINLVDLKDWISEILGNAKNIQRYAKLFHIHNEGYLKSYECKPYQKSASVTKDVSFFFGIQCFGVEYVFNISENP